MYKNFNKYQNNKGLTLIELMVAATIAIIVLLVALRIFLGVKSHYNAASNKLSADVKALSAQTIIYKFIKNAGFACKFGYMNQTYHDRTVGSILPNGSVIRVGTRAFPGAAGFPETLTQGCEEECYSSGSSYIMLMRQNDNSTELVTSPDTPTTLSELRVERIAQLGKLRQGDYLALCSRDNIDLVSFDANRNGVIGLEQDLGQDTSHYNLGPPDTHRNIYHYYPGDYVGRYELEILYIRNTGDEDANHQEINSLFLYTKRGPNDSGSSDELVRGVEDLQIGLPEFIRGSKVTSSSVVWNNITKDTNISKLDNRAINVTLTIDGKEYEKVIVL